MKEEVDLIDLSEEESSMVSGLRLSEEEASDSERPDVGSSCALCAILNPNHRRRFAEPTAMRDHAAIHARQGHTKLGRTLARCFPDWRPSAGELAELLGIDATEEETPTPTANDGRKSKSRSYSVGQAVRVDGYGRSGRDKPWTARFERYFTGIHDRMRTAIDAGETVRCLGPDCGDWQRVRGSSGAGKVLGTVASSIVLTHLMGERHLHIRQITCALCSIVLSYSKSKAVEDHFERTHASFEPSFHDHRRAAEPELRRLLPTLFPDFATEASESEEEGSDEDEEEEEEPERTPSPPKPPTPPPPPPPKSDFPNLEPWEEAMRRLKTSYQGHGNIACALPDCSWVDAGTLNVGHLEGHIAGHFRKVLFYCHSCSESFKSRPKLRAHDADCDEPDIRLSKKSAELLELAERCFPTAVREAREPKKPDEEEEDEDEAVSTSQTVSSVASATLSAYKSTLASFAKQMMDRRAEAFCWLCPIQLPPSPTQQGFMATLEAHVLTTHLQSPGYQCSSCDESVVDIVSHYQGTAAHDPANILYADLRPELQPHLRDSLRDCFTPRQQPPVPQHMGMPIMFANSMHPYQNFYGTY